MFNYREEKRKFDRAWARKSQQYSEQGMTQDSINNLYELDHEEFCQRRTYENRNQKLPSEVFSDDETPSVLFRKYSSLSTTFDESNFSDRFAWVETIDNDNLAKKLKALSREDLELLTMYAIEGYTQVEIADIKSGKQSNFSKKINKIKKLLE